MKKFDLQTALNHPEKVTDGCNNKFVKFYLIKELKTKTQLLGVEENGSGMWYTEEGNIYQDATSNFNLCMLPEEKIVYTNVYIDGTTGIAHKSIELAKKHNGDVPGMLCILKITITDDKDVTTEIVHKY